VADRQHLVLIGLMGVSKSTVGRRCAERLGRRFVDTEDVVVERARMPLTQALTTLGEEKLRDLEQTVVGDTVASVEPIVIACGGGTAIRPENRDLLRSAGMVIWLRAPTSILATRIGGGEGRPMLTGNPVHALERFAVARGGPYSAAAHAVVDADTGGVDDVSDRVLLRFDEERGVPGDPSLRG
jgi:shikimate kinase